MIIIKIYIFQKNKFMFNQINMDITVKKRINNNNSESQKILIIQKKQNKYLKSKANHREKKKIKEI